MRAIVSTQGLVPWYGGSAFSEALLCSQLARFTELTVLCPQGRLDYAFARSCGLTDVRLYHPREAFEAWKDSRHWLSVLFEEADVFHLNGYGRWEDCFFARLCSRKKIPYILQPRGKMATSLRRKVSRQVFHLSLGTWVVKHASRLLALSQFERDSWPSRFPDKKISIIPNAVTLPSANTLAANAPSKMLDKIGPYYLYLGKLERRRNLSFLVSTFARYVKEGGTASLLIVGPSEQNHDKELDAEITKLGAEGKIQLMHPVYDEDRWLYMKKAKALLYPVSGEAFGRTPFESIAVGTPAVVPHDGGAAESFKPFLPACVYRRDDADGMLAALRMIETGGEELKDGVRRAQQWVHECLSGEKIAERVFRLYQEAMDPGALSSRLANSEGRS